jgi:hypothetical protein
VGVSHDRATGVIAPETHGDVPRPRERFRGSVPRKPVTRLTLSFGSSRISLGNGPIRGSVGFVAFRPRHA